MNIKASIGFREMELPDSGTNIILGAFNIIRIHHECDGGIEKSFPRITDWHHQVCRVMTNGDHEGLIFLSHPQTNYGFFFLLTNEYLFYIGKKHEKGFQLQ